MSKTISARKIPYKTYPVWEGDVTQYFSLGLNTRTIVNSMMKTFIVIALTLLVSLATAKPGSASAAQKIAKVVEHIGSEDSGEGAPGPFINAYANFIEAVSGLIDKTSETLQCATAHCSLGLDQARYIFDVAKNSMSRPSPTQSYEHPGKGTHTPKHGNWSSSESASFA